MPVLRDAVQRSVDAREAHAKVRREPGQERCSAPAGTAQHADAAEHAAARSPARPATSEQPGQHVGRRAQPQLQQQR